MNFITGIASKNAKFKNFRQEYSLGILIVLLLRIVTASISIYAGYFYFKNLLTGISTENKTVPLILSITVLLIVEILSAYLLSKLTKASLNRKYINAFVLLIFSVFTFGVSFISSTNGLSMKQSKKADISTEILSNKDLQAENIKLKYSELIQEQKANIKLIRKNPQGWSEGKRAYLTTQQLKDISNINNEIKAFRSAEKEEITAIKKQSKTELKANRQEMTATADKYYLFISIVLIISALCNISLQIFYKIIYKEERADQSALSEFKNAKQAIFSNLQASLNNDILKLANSFTGSLIVEKNEPLLHSIIENKNTPPGIGFKNPKIDFEINDKAGNYKEFQKENNLKGKEPYNENRINENRTEQRTCKNCGNPYIHKHHKQLYCSDACRVQFWENKTGKTLNFKKKK